MTKRHPRALAVGTGLLVASSLGLGALGTTGAGAAEEPPSDPPTEPTERPPRPVRTARLCDNTVCYVAWRVVDSDHDGVSDADEIMAGTDPWDPASRPRPEVVVELAAAEQLPSFQAGLGAFVLFPVEIAKLNAEQLPDLGEGAFPIDTREDALTRVGISGELLKEMGLDPSSDGFTIGLDRPSQDGDLPVRRVAGLDVRTISAGGGSGGLQPGVQGGGVIGTSHNADGSTTMWLSDGGKVVTSTENGVTTTTSYGPGDELLGSSSSTSDSVGSDVPTDVTTTIDSDGKGDVTGTTISTTYHLPNGTTVSTVEKRTYLRDADGKITGQKVVTSTSVSDGRSGSTTSKVEVCDAQGKDCTPPVDHGGSEDDHGDDGSGGGDHDDDGDDGDDGSGGDDHDPDEDGTGPIHDDADDDHGFWNPDADTATVTLEVVEGVIRMRGAAITTVQNWTAPEADDDPELDRWGTIAYVDDTGQTLLVLSEPRVTEAQPEFDPNLPSPLDAAPGPPDGPDNCDGLCYTG